MAKKTRARAIYVALITINAQNGWTCIRAGYNKLEVQESAEAALKGDDSYTKTEFQNLRVVALYIAKRAYRFDWKKFSPLWEPEGRYSWVGSV